MIYMDNEEMRPRGILGGLNLNICEDGSLLRQHRHWTGVPFRPLRRDCAEVRAYHKTDTRAYTLRGA